MRNQVIQSDQDVHMYGLWWMKWKLLLYDLSPYINSFESMAISSFFPSFFHGPSCAHIFFLSFFFNTWTFMCPYFILIAHASLLFFNKNWRERSTHIVEYLFCGMSGWYNAIFSKKYSKGVYGMHVKLDHESMKRILPRVTTV